MECQNRVLGSVAEGPKRTRLAQASGKQEEKMCVVTVLSAWPSHLLGLMQMHPFSRPCSWIWWSLISKVADE